MTSPPIARRKLLAFGAAGAGTLMFPSARTALAAPAEPHFFLLIMMGGGADAAYTYDARPLSMTAAGRVHNYLGEQPGLLRGRNGQTTLATRLTWPLIRLQDRFSILNGVVMTPSFDGHLQNVNFLLTGDPFGGESFVPHLNLATPSRPSDLLDAVVPTAPIASNITNDARTVPLKPQSAGGLANHLRNVAPFAKGSELMDFIQGRVAANARGAGRFAAGAARMETALASASDMHARLARIVAPDDGWNAEDQAVSLMAQCFRLGIARSAVYQLPEHFDTHSPDEAQKQPQLFGTAIARVVDLFDALIETPYDARRSMLDVTTVMVATEFTRTLRSSDAPVTNTGTHHNQYCNSLWLGGKGIKPGLVIGASDLADEKALPSKAHLALDPNLERAVGRPFDFAKLQPRNDQPETFDLRNHLTVASVINTVYSLFDVPRERFRILARNLPVAPTLDGLRA
jgi:hypothetical protein